MQTFSNLNLEKIEFEVWAEGSHPAADLNMSLGAFNMGDETWTLTTQARTLSDGTAPVTLASGMAKDTGGSRKFLTVSSKLRWHLALDLARDPARKATAIKDIEAALKAAGR